ncbi:hypothetical protein NX059_007245 [Plenodomus lindquistii]|nr:hypothetical protein NX059_007245 [Plenodomus lindquistii]
MSGYIHDNVRHKLLNRLRWNILANIESIEILTGTPNRFTTVPLLGHPLADEPLAQPPVSQVEVRSYDILEQRAAEKMLEAEAEEKDVEHMPSPDPLTIVNQDDSPITLGQFVTEVHAYLDRNIG